MLPRRMPTIEIVNQKGGSAKTAVASHTIFRAVGRNMRTLAIDFDKQASLTSFFNVQAGEGYATSAQCFDGPIAAVPVKCGNYLDFLPADRALRMCSGAGAEAALHAAANGGGAHGDRRRQDAACDSGAAWMDAERRSARHGTGLEADRSSAAVVVSSWLAGDSRDAAGLDPDGRPRRTR